MLDPTIAAAIITASGGLLDKLIELAGKSDPNTQAVKAIENIYDKIAQEVTSHSARTLLALEQTGSNQSTGQISKIVAPMALRQEPNSSPFESDPTYRLKFLCVLGLVQMSGGSEYAITHFGAAFLSKARKDTKRYAKVFVA